MQPSRRYPDRSDILARKAAGRQQNAALSFAEKLAKLDAMREHFAPFAKARQQSRRTLHRVEQHS
jgi:hypothetical protein